MARRKAQDRGPDGRTPVVGPDGRVVSWRPGSAEQAKLRTELASITLRAGDWCNRENPDGLFDDRLMALEDHGDGDELLAYCLEHSRTSILDEKDARWQAHRRATAGDRGSLCPDPWNWEAP